MKKDVLVKWLEELALDIEVVSLIPETSKLFSGVPAFVKKIHVSALKKMGGGGGKHSYDALRVLGQNITQIESPKCSKPFQYLNSFQLHPINFFLFIKQLFIP